MSPSSSLPPSWCDSRNVTIPHPPPEVWSPQSATGKTTPSRNTYRNPVERATFPLSDFPVTDASFFSLFNRQVSDYEEKTVLDNFSSSILFLLK